MKKVFFGCGSVSKPLNQIPGAVFLIKAADQIKTGIFSGKTSGLYIEEKKIFRRSQAFYRVGLREGEMFLYGNHERLLLVFMDICSGVRAHLASLILNRLRRWNFRSNTIIPDFGCDCQRVLHLSV